MFLLLNKGKRRPNLGASDFDTLQNYFVILTSANDEVWVRANQRFDTANVELNLYVKKLSINASIIIWLPQVMIVNLVF